MKQLRSVIPTNTLGDFYYRHLAIGTLLVALLGFAFPQLLREMEVVLFVAVIFVIGIPHGATDHLLDQYSKGKKFSYPAFLSTYIVLGVSYAILWYFFPLFSLFVFIVISTYHFGQSQLLYLRMPDRHWLKVISYLTWGSYTLCCIILLNWNESWQILDEIFPGLFNPWLSYVALTPYLLGFLLLVNIALLLLLYRRKNINRREFVGEVLNLAIIIGLAYYTPLLVGFAIYFGLWHSLISVRIEIEKVRRQEPRFSIQHFAKTALPLSLSTLVIFSLVFLVNQQFGLFHSPYLLFFILISILTLPHVLFVQEFYTTKAP